MTRRTPGAGQEYEPSVTVAEVAQLNTSKGSFGQLTQVGYPWKVHSIHPADPNPGLKIRVRKVLEPQGEALKENKSMGCKPPQARISRKCPWIPIVQRFLGCRKQITDTDGHR